MACEHHTVEYSKEALDFDGEIVIAHEFPCQDCETSALVWDTDVDYTIIEE